MIPTNLINFWEINTEKLKAMFCNQVERVCFQPELDSSHRVGVCVCVKKMELDFSRVLSEWLSLPSLCVE